MDGDVNRGFTADKPNRIWTMEGFVYLAVILDVYSRYVVGWALRKDQDASLVLSAFSMAIKIGDILPLVHRYCATQFDSG